MYPVFVTYQVCVFSVCCVYFSVFCVCVCDFSRCLLFSAFIPSDVGSTVNHCKDQKNTKQPV